MAKENKSIGGDIVEEVVTPTETPIAEPTPKVQAKKNSVYNTMEEVPEIYRPAVRVALKKIGINGKHIFDVIDGEFNLTDEKLWNMDMMYKCGMFR